MKCYQLSATPGLADLKAGSRPEPVAAQGELLVRVRATSLNFHDYLVVTGVLPASAGRIPMSDGVGEIVALGDGVDGFAIGDRVMGTFFPSWMDGGPTAAKIAQMRGEHVDGFAAEYVALPAAQFTAVPDGWSDVEAATLPCAALTAWRALVVEGGVKPGDRVLVQGSGGVSLFAAQIAALAGATVIATTSSEEKAQKLKSLGVAHVVNYTRTPKWGKEVEALTGGVGVDHVAEVVGGNLAQSMRALRTGGALYIVGALSRQPIELSTLSAVQSNGRLVGLTVGSRQHQADMVRALNDSSIRPVIDRTFAFDELADAFRHQASGTQFGKICVTV